MGTLAAQFDYSSNNNLHKDNVYDIFTGKKKDGDDGGGRKCRRTSKSRPVTDDELLKIQKELITMKRYDILLYINMVLCIALRVGDMTDLKWNDVFNYDGTMKEGISNWREEKTRKDKMIPFSDSFKNSIYLYMKQTKKTFEDLDMTDDGYIFKSRQNRNKYGETKKDGHISTNRINNIIHKACENVGLDPKTEHITTHAFRKTFGYNFYEKTHDILALMEVYNHSSVRVTKIYACIEDEKIKSVYNSVDLNLDFV